MVYIYSLIVVIASGIFGLFSRTIMQDMGLVPNFSSGLLLICAAGALYIFLQASFMAIMRVYQPTKSHSTYLTEMASNAAVLALIPFILHVSIAWPSAVLEKVAPLVFLAVFSVIHLFFKLATFYASHQGAISRRRDAMAYMITAVVMLIFMVIFQGRWMASLEKARIQAPEETQVMTLNSMAAQARIIPEGAILQREVTPDSAQTITAHWANVNGGQLETIYATFTMQGNSNTLYESSVTLPAHGWGEVRVPNDFIPDGMHHAEVRWTRKQEPNWQRIFGLRPIVFSATESETSHEVALSGPYFHYERPVVGKPNIIVIMIDGLAANHLSLMGYTREVTPSLDKLGYTGLAMPNTKVSKKDIKSTVQQLVTGTRSREVLLLDKPASIVDVLREAGYSTIAFTEGDASSDSDLIYGSGAEKGFELFNAAYSPTLGSKQTVTEARQWINTHQEIPFFMLLRLRGLEHAPSATSEVKGTYPVKGVTRPIDSFDNALLDLDAQIGSLLKFIRDRELSKNTYVLVTAPYGHDFSLQRSGQLLPEPSTRVPLILNGPGIRTGKVSREVDMADIGVTISDITGIPYPKLVEGQSVR